ncbi:MAG TPA: MFS transporter [Marinilabiliales bacterium]|jgi:SP family sugar porter-like MFS transporter|nr:MAG: MFS transporter [Bacteroidetes bacterium GWA2_40_14]OFX61134.1 MAG: MFS transporter [Bacteroidetes bacterium GWC2_40_13]OFX73058.1 MAG: MFS transporter [Bacteroidetes bacterium GWD2_40_43]OFX91536.1 MAG: MFS transporter [Bacteroidetes bacterium GWE2_40_63]OFY19697.1 MAG: MFS transporter [Bacteroidetes bacterium GWF2_40_13]OFZ25461.1 MAG: MFS transporter [Bacteroidetes bacterium RIFOXYC2_FULL_40_12]HAN00409.1 MFS transporter [Marinilabiliales bacterium]
MQTVKTINKPYVLLITLVSAMGGLLFGYDWVVIGGAKPFYEQFFGIADLPMLQGWAMSIALLGCLVGAMLAGFLADTFGRKKLLIAAAVIFLVSSYGTGSASVFHLFLIARFFGGIGIGLAADLSPMYIAEIAPKSIRGRLVSLNQLTIVIGILAAQITNWLIAEPIPSGFSGQQIFESWNGQMGWRWMFWGAAFPSSVFLVSLFFIPESPRWSALKEKQTQALRVLTRIGGSAYAQSEINTMNETTATHHSGGLKMLFSKPMRTVLLIGLFLAIFQQWSGTNVIFNYAQEIFQSAGFQLSDMLFNIVVTGIANLAFTFVAIFTVDKIGRKALMLIGAGGLSTIYLLVGLLYYLQVSGSFLVVLVVLAIAIYAMSLGPVTWVILSEIFPNKIRGVSMATATFALWAACFTLTYTFPMLNATLNSSGTFWIYSLLCAIGFVIILRWLPETKGKSLEELERELVHEE